MTGISPFGPFFLLFILFDFPFHIFNIKLNQKKKQQQKKPKKQNNNNFGSLK